MSKQERYSTPNPDAAVDLMTELCGPDEPAYDPPVDPRWSLHAYRLRELRGEELRWAMGATGSCIDPNGNPVQADSGATADPFGLTGPK